MTFDQFPKERPPLPEAIREIYDRHYKENREGSTAATSLSRRLEGWLHRQVAKDLASHDRKAATLEIGAGTLNQLPYEPVVGPYDVIEPFRFLYEGSDLLKRVRNIYADIAEIPERHRYDRITSIASFEHICDLPDVVARSATLLNEGGSLRVSIPSEGTFLWGLGRKLTGLEFRLKHGLDYDILMDHEHVNDAREIEELLTFFFRKVRRRVFGICPSVSLYMFFACSDPRVDRCRERLPPGGRPGRTG